MVFSITKAFLVALSLRSVFGQSDQNEQIFWDSFALQDIDSMATPSNTPTHKPSGITPEPTSIPTAGISDAPSDGPSLSSVSNVPSFVPSIPACESIGTIICSVPEFSTLCDLIDTAGLASALNEDIFTIFAPINDAFESIPPEIANAVTNVDILRETLLYHTVPEVEILSENLVCDTKVMMGNSEDTTTMCTGEDVFQVGNGNSPDVLPKIIAQDGIACNGIIHAIDQVILPSIDVPTPAPIDSTIGSSQPSLGSTLVETSGTPSLGSTSSVPSFGSTSDVPSLGSTVNDLTDSPTPDTCQSIAEVVCILPEFEILCALVGDADLAGVLGGGDQLTVFAPINDAFEALPLELADAVISDSELATKILLSHAVSGALFSTDLECGGEIPMVSGEETTTVCADGKIFQTGSGNTADSLPQVIAPDGVACNGVIHAIDNVILPGDR